MKTHVILVSALVLAGCASPPASRTLTRGQYTIDLHDTLINMLVRPISTNMNLYVAYCPFVRVDYTNLAGVKFATCVDPRDDSVDMTMTPTNGPKIAVHINYGDTNTVVEINTGIGGARRWIIDSRRMLVPESTDRGPFGPP